MQVDHPAHRLLVITRIENILRRPLPNLLQSSLSFLILHPDVINLVEASLVLQFKNLSIVFTNAFPQLFFLDAPFLEIVVILLVEASLHLHKAFYESARPELFYLLTSATRCAGSLPNALRNSSWLAKHFTEVNSLVTEHRKCHEKNFFHHAHVAENVIQVLKNCVGQLLVAGFDIV